MVKSGFAKVAATGLCLAVASLAQADNVTVFAAASMTTAMDQIGPQFEAATGHDLTVSFAGSSALARQIQQGAPADIFISVNSDWMDLLETEGLIEDGTRFDLLNNSIVLVAADSAVPPVEIGPDMDLAALLGEGKLAMAQVDSVPAGIYGKAALENLGQWPAVKAQVVQTKNVRAALAFVALGEAPYGIVYATDARADKNVTVAGRFPPDTHPPIVYPAAGVAGRTGPAVADFLSYLRGPAARMAFEAEGFGMTGE